MRVDNKNQREHSVLSAPFSGYRRKLASLFLLRLWGRGRVGGGVGEGPLPGPALSPGDATVPWTLAHT